jgi:peptidoglycan-associated lipoprotein
MRWFPLLLVAFVACSSKKEARTPRDVPITSPGRTVEEPAEKPIVQESGRDLTQPRFGPVYFAYDDALVSPRASEELVRLAGYLERQSSVTVTLEGHTDERGSPEYNIALGDQRAQACREYLVRLGIASHRLRTRSFGEERPVDAATSEEAWAKNRRVEFLVQP